MDKNQMKNWYMAAISFVLGALAGSLSALLLAPKSGLQTRRQISKLTKNAYEQGMEGAGKQADMLKKSVKNLGSKLRKVS